MEGESDSLAFRRLVATVAEQISDAEARKLVYIHLYSQRDSIFRETKNISLKLFVALEFAGTFSAARPEGLLNILEKDLKNRQLANMVKLYIRRRKRKPVNIVDINGADNAYTEPPELENDTHLRMCYKLALAQTNVLVKHLDALREAVAKDVATPDGAAQEALENISSAASALAKLKEKAEAGFEIIGSLTNRIHSNTSTAEDNIEKEQDNYEEVDAEIGSDAIFESVEIKLPKPGPQLRKKISSLAPGATAQDDDSSTGDQENYEDVEVMPKIDAEAVFDQDEVEVSNISKPKPQIRKKMANKTSSLPLTSKQKPALKPKPAKLKLQLESWNVPGSSFDSSRASSMPLLDLVNQASSPAATEASSDATKLYDDYIEPILIEDDEENSSEEEIYQHKNSRLLTKTTSLPFFDSKQSPKSPFRPLPDLPTINQEEPGPTYAQLQTKTEDYEPIYDEIVEHTLLSRLNKKPRKESTSSSD